jgi:hypothetical protein
MGDRKMTALGNSHRVGPGRQIPERITPGIIGRRGSDVLDPLAQQRDGGPAHRWPLVIVEHDHAGDGCRPCEGDADLIARLLR